MPTVSRRLGLRHLQQTESADYITVVTDANGMFSFTGLLPGDYQIAVVPVGFSGNYATLQNWSQVAVDATESGPVIVPPLPAVRTGKPLLSRPKQPVWLYRTQIKSPAAGVGSAVTSCMIKLDKVAIMSSMPGWQQVGLCSQSCSTCTAWQDMEVSLMV